ncbi:MAG: carbohydrate binding domain-containing protein [Spirochaetota bacterium]
MRNTWNIIWMGVLIMASLAAYDHPREGTEWTITYVYNATDNKLPRVLLVGDSICNGYQSMTRDELAGTAYVGFYATSKCVSDRSYLKELSFIMNEYEYAVIHFNNGLHSLNTPPDEWEKALRAAFALIRKERPKAKLVWCSSTPLKDAALTEKAKVLNEIGAKVAAEFELPVNDLFSLMDGLDRAKYWTDTFHHNTDAKKMQAKQVADSVRAHLGGKTATKEEAAAALARAASDTGPDGKITISSAAPSVRDGSFDTAADWSLYPTAKPDVITLEYVNEDGASGKCAKITLGKAGGQFYQSRPALIPGASYTLSLRVKGSGAQKIQAHVRTQKPPYQFYGDKTFDVGTEWTEVSTIISVPAEYKADEHVLFFVPQTPGTYFIDDVRIMKQ